MKKQLRLYNVIFPIWMLIFIPVIWLVVLPANFIIDSLVVLVSLKIMGETEIFSVYKSIILKVWLLGFLADILGSALLFFSQLGYSHTWYEYIQGPVAYNPLDNIFSLLYVLIVVVIAGAAIYFLNLRFSFKKTQLGHKKRRAVSLALAIITAPYLFLVPMQVFTHGPGGMNKADIFTHHIVPDAYTSMDVTAPSGGEEIDWHSTEKEYYYFTYQMREAINTSARLWKKEQAPQRESDYLLSFHDSSADSGKAVAVQLWVEGEEVFFRHKDKFYRARREDVREIKAMLHSIRTGEPMGDREYQEEAAEAELAE